MKHFKLTIEGIEGQMLYDTMKLLYTRFELKDEADLCNMLLSEFFSERELRDLTIFVNGRDWKSQIEFFGNLRLIGDKAGKSDDYCDECGHPDIRIDAYYYVCDHCGHTRLDDIAEFSDGDINDYSGFIDIGKLY